MSCAHVRIHANLCSVNPYPFCRQVDVRVHILPPLLHLQRLTSISRGDRGMDLAGVKSIGRTYSQHRKCSPIVPLAAPIGLGHSRSTHGTVAHENCIPWFAIRATGEEVESGRQGGAARTSRVCGDERTDHTSCADTLRASVPDFFHSPLLSPRQLLEWRRRASGEAIRHRRRFRSSS